MTPNESGKNKQIRLTQLISYLTNSQGAIQINQKLSGKWNLYPVYIPCFFLAKKQQKTNPSLPPVKPWKDPWTVPWKNGTLPAWAPQK